MKNLSAADVSALQFKSSKTNSSKTDEIMRSVAFLRVGEGVLIDRSEWPLKTAPRSGGIPKRYKQPGAKYRVNALYDNSGWAVIRLS